MPTLQALRAEAKAVGLPRYSRMNKAALADALGTPPTSHAEESGHTERPLIGVPTEPEKANLSEAEMETAIIAGRKAASAGGSTVENLGVPTEPEKAGIFPDPEPSQPLSAQPQPAHSGNDIEAGIGVPTEPDRGGLNPLEVKLSGAEANTAAAKAAEAAVKAAEAAVRKAAKAAKKAAKKATKKDAKRATSK